MGTLSAADSETIPNVKTKNESFYGRYAVMSFMKELFTYLNGSKLSDEDVYTTKKSKYNMSRSDKPSNKSINI